MPAAQAPNSMIPIVAIVLIFYFLVFKPQKKEQKDRKKMVEGLKKHDKIVTTSGIHGLVALIKEKTVVIKVDDKTRIEFDKDVIVNVISEEKKVSEKK